MRREARLLVTSFKCRHQVFVVIVRSDTSKLIVLGLTVKQELERRCCQRGVDIIGLTLAVSFTSGGWMLISVLLHPS